ncbi:MAG: hypothetical protein Q9170_004826 [Blastenia crenularia]
MPLSTNPSFDPNASFTFPQDGATLGSIGGDLSLVETSTSGTAPFPMYTNAGEHARFHNPEPRGGACVKPTRLPSRRDVREWNAAHKLSQQNHAEPTNRATPGRGDTLIHFAAFANIVSATNVDISGIALTVADYLTWAREKPEQCNEEMLEIFEARMREVADLATNQAVVTLESIVASQPDTTRINEIKASFESAMARETHGKADYFRSIYDIQRSLSDQRASSTAGLE